MIIRNPERGRYTAVSRTTINDGRLSFRARGVLLYLLDKPDDWQTDSRAIANAGPEGRDAVRAALRELEQYGYLERDRGRLDSGRFATVTYVYETPRRRRPEPSPRLPLA